MKHLLNARDITIKKNKKVLLKNTSFAIQDNEKIVIVGRNGTGKSSLIKVLAQYDQIDDGELHYAKNVKIGYLTQNSNLSYNHNVQEILQKEYQKHHDGSWEEQKEIKYLFNIFRLKGIINRNLNDLSGGQKRRVAILKALLLEPDLLLLDEPTNHLDLEMVKALEEIIKTYPKTCVLISHDRYFVDTVASRILEIEDQRIYTHRGGFSEYLKLREKRLTNLEVAEKKKQDYLNREREWVVSGVKARETKNKARLKRYYEIKSKPSFRRRIDPDLLIPNPPLLGDKILKTINLKVARGNQNIVKELSFKFEPNYKLGLIGPNGSGKTTLLKTLIGSIPSISGKVIIGDTTIINYFDQARSEVNSNKSILEEVCKGKERVVFGDKTISSYAYLKRFLFTSEEIRKSSKHVSGGEKARIILAKQFLKPSNFLILDEPTNDLDIETLNVLESSLKKFTGCLIVVSHDRYFLNQVCNHILSLDGDGNFTLSTGNYDTYVKKHNTNSSASRRDKKLSNRKKRMKKNKNTLITLQKELAGLEEKIKKIEIKIKDKEEKFNDPVFFQRETLSSFIRSLENDKKDLETLECLYLSILEKINNENN